MEHLLFGKFYRDAHPGMSYFPSVLSYKNRKRDFYFFFFEIVTDSVNELHMIYNIYVYFLLL